MVLSGVHRYALALFYPPSTWDVFRSLPWCARYVSRADDDVVCWLAVDELKRAVPQCSEQVAEGESVYPHGPSLVVHANADWSKQYQATRVSDVDSRQHEEDVKVRA